MKYLIPTAAFLGLALCVYLHGQNRPVKGPPASGRPSPVEPAEVAEVGRVPSDVAVAKAPEIIPAASKPAPVEAAREPNSATQEMIFVLRDELGLSEEQQLRVNKALEERASELADCHEAIRKSGVFIPQEYGKQLQRMKDGWFRKIDGALDSRQHLIFEDLVVKGFLRPGTEFAADLNNMTVVR